MFAVHALCVRELVAAPPMRIAFIASLVLFGCVSAAPRAQLEGSGSIAAVPSKKPYEITEKISPLPQAVSCNGRDGGTRFRDATEEWNLGQVGLKVQGNRLTVADLDNDGYPDLVVHPVTSNLRPKKNLPDGGRQLVWQLMNRPSENGESRVFVDETGNGLFDLREKSDTEYRSTQLAVFGDIDNDGDLDSFVGTNTDPTKSMTDPGDRSQILLNDGTGHFTMAPSSATTPRASELWPTTAAAFTDSDRDGRLDVFVGYWYEAYGYSYTGMQARLYVGGGNGEFDDFTSLGNLLTDGDGFSTFTNHRPAYGVTACDVDDDGAPELLLSAYGRQANLLYRNDGTGHFVDQSRTSGFAGDDNVDFRDNEFFKCWCMQFPTNAACAGVSGGSLQCPTPAGSNWGAGVDDQPWRNNGNTFTSWCGDVDGDGKNDVYNAEIHHWWAGGSSDSSELLRNTSTPGNAKFTRPGNAASGLGLPRVGGDWNEGGLMVAGGDLDNDGLMDLVVAASDYPDQFGVPFAQRADGTFQDARAAWNLQHPCMSGLAIADFDRDGDLDIIAGASTARDCAQTWKKGNEVRLYENQASGTNWLLLHLEGDGTSTNRSAIGAKVTVKSGGHTVTREVSGGYGHFGMQNDVNLHVGLGGCDGADEITVRWPNKSSATQTFTRVPSNQFVRLKQGEDAPFKVRLGE